MKQEILKKLTDRLMLAQFDVNERLDMAEKGREGSGAYQGHLMAEFDRAEGIEQGLREAIAIVTQSKMAIGIWEPHIVITDNFEE
jgi:hypothetical protein